MQPAADTGTWAQELDTMPGPRTCCKLRAARLKGPTPCMYILHVGATYTYIGFARLNMSNLIDQRLAGFS